MSRSDRLKRINAALATREKRARQELAQANAELAATEAGLRSVLDQCRQVTSLSPASPATTNATRFDAAELDAAERDAAQRDSAKPDAAGLADTRSGVGRSGGDGLGTALPVAARMAVVQSGLAEAAQRETDRNAASDDAAAKAGVWLEANSRHEAATRILDRWQESADVEAARRADAEIDEVITARRSVASNQTDAGRTAPQSARFRKDGLQ